MVRDKNVQGLGGWLSLVGVGIVVSPLRIAAQVFPAYAGLLSEGSWAVLTTPGTEAYHPLWGPMLLGEIAINVGLMAAWVYIAFLFFSKRKAFPGWYIGILLFTLLFILMDAVVMGNMLPDGEVFDADTTMEFGRALVVALIWVPYMLVSKRVRATFVR